jgi:hypothetical protein
MAYLAIWPMETLSGSEIRLLAGRTASNHVRLSWNSEVGKLYRPIAATNLAGPWQKTLAPVAATAAETQALAASDQAGSQWFRVAELPLDGAFRLPNRNPISGTVVLEVVGLSASNQIRYLGLLDITGNHTNLLDWIDGRNPASRTFTVNTAHLKNGPHHLQLELIDDHGDPSSSAVHLAYSEVTEMVVTNAISVVSDRETEWKRHLRFLPNAASGTWWAFATNDQNALVQSTNRSIAGSTNAVGEITFEDKTVSFTNSYRSAYFDYAIWVSPAPGLTNRYSFRSPTVPKREAYEGLVVEQWLAPFNANPVRRDHLDGMFESMLFEMTRFSDHFDFVTQTYGARPDEWNLVYGPFEWETCSNYLAGAFGSAPTHLYFWGFGGPDQIGLNVPWSEEFWGLSTATLSSFSRAHRLHFVFFDGFNHPRSLIRLLTGITKNRTRADLMREGQRPRAAFYFEGLDFSRYAGQDDLSREDSEFRQFFIETMWASTPLSGIYPGRPMDVNLGLIKARYPALMEKLRWIGSVTNVFIDEIEIGE